MEKNKKKLILAVVCALIVGILSGFAGFKLKDSFAYDLEYQEGHQVIYTVDSDDSAVIEKAKDVLVRRFENFGAADVSAKVDGKIITLNVADYEGFEASRTFMTQKGELTFRNYNDEQVMDASVLNEDYPLSVTDNEGTTTIIINVADGTEFANQTTKIAADTNKYLVLWVDWQEGDKFADQMDKEDHKFLAGATVTSALNSTCYINTSKSLEEAGNIVRMVDGGALPAAVTETSCVALEPLKGSKNAPFLALYLTVLLVAGLLFYRFGVEGCVSAIMLAGFSFAWFRSMQLAGYIMNGKLIAMFAVVLTSVVYLIAALYNKFRYELLRGVNLVTAVDNAYKVMEKPMWEGAIAQILLGTFALIFANKATSPYAAGVTAAGAFTLIFIIMANKFMLKAVVESNYFTNKAWYGIDVSKIPDVEKGENYVRETDRKEMDYGRNVTGNLLYYVFGVLAVAGLVLAMIKDVKGTLLTLLAVVLTLVIGFFYARFSYRNHYPLIFVICVCLFASAGGLLSGSGIGYIIAAGGLAGATVFVTISELKKGFREISSQKLNDQKLINIVNQTANELDQDYLIALIAAATCVLLSGIIGHNFVAGTALAVVICSYPLILLACKVWFDGSKKNISRRSKGKKKNNRKELKETTIFGMNEIK